MRRPVIDASGLVVNVVVLKDGADWAPPAGFELGAVGGEIGDVWSGAAYIKPPSIGLPVSMIDDPAAGPASDAQAGPVELATSAETIIGTDATRAVTPAGLAAVVVNGGVAGDVLAKVSSTNRDLTWVAPLAMSSGTWVPVLTASTTSGTHTYSAQAGTYIKLGPIVHYTGRLALSAKDAAMAGSVRIGGLPFTVRNVANEFCIANVVATNVNFTGTDVVIPYVLATGGQSYLGVAGQSDNTAPANIQAAAIVATSGFYVSGFYFTDL